MGSSDIGPRPKLEMNKTSVSRGSGTSCRAFVPIRWELSYEGDDLLSVTMYVMTPASLCILSLDHSCLVKCARQTS